MSGEIWSDTNKNNRERCKEYGHIKPPSYLVCCERCGTDLRGLNDNRMTNEQFKKYAEFEESQNISAPELPKQKQHFFYVILQDTTGKITDISHYQDYDVALMRGMNKAKETSAYYSIFDLNGRFVDGNFVGK